MIRYFLILLSYFLLFNVLSASAQFGEKNLLISNIPDEKYEASVDLNQDGFQDIIVFRPTENQTTGGHYVKYNNGSGEFLNEQLIKNDDVAWTQITPADIDGDGQLDLAIYQEENQKLVWLQNEGSGTEFSWRFNIITDIRESYSSHKSSFIFEDIDGDDDLDFLCGCSNSWYKNNGEGEFTESFVVSGDINQVFFAADLGQNGKMDIVAYNSPTNTIIGYEYQADDEWVAQTLVSSENLYQYNTEQRAEPFDLDNDGDIDIVHYGIELLSQGEIRIFRNDSDSFNRVPITAYDEDGDPINFEVVDYNNDGLPDIVGGSKFTDPYEDASFTGDDEIFWLKNESGSFTAETIREQYYMLDVGRYNQDNQYDFVAWRPKGVDLLLNDNGGFNRQALVKWTSIEPDQEIRTADLNGDDRTDFLLISSNLNNIDFPGSVYSGYSAIAVLLSKSSGDYEVQVLNDVTSIMPQSLEFADLDNDGDLDVVVSLNYSLTSFSAETEEWEAIWYENEGNGSFSGRKPIGRGFGIDYSSLKVFDSDGDGYPEVATFLKVFKNNSGSFSESNSIPLPTAVADLNGDGAVDIIGEENWYENDGSGNYNEQTEISGTPVDFDGDGDIDVVEDDWRGNDNLDWYENDGSGNFTTNSFPSIDNLRGYVDVDADGDADAVVFGRPSRSEDDEFYWLENTDGKGKFENRKEFINEPPTFPFHFTDFDSDGDDDLFMAKNGLTRFENLNINQASTPLSLSLENTEGLQQDTITIPVKIGSGFADLTTLSFSLVWDTEVATYAEVQSTENLTLETGSTEAGQVGITWQNESGSSKTDGSTLLSLRLVLTGEEESSTDVNFADSPTASSATNADGKTVTVNTSSAQITINQSEAPSNISLGNFTIQENQPEGTAVGQFNTTDSDNSEGFTYELVEGEGGEDNGSFEINGRSLITKGPLDYETKETYNIRVRVTDTRGKQFEKTFAISVEDVDDTNNSPTDLAISKTSINENQKVGTVVGELSANDEDDDPLEFNLTEGDGDDDNASFAVDGNQLLTAEVFDFEEKAKYSVRIQVKDGRGGNDSKAFMITIGDVDESTNNAPTALSLTGAAVEENQSPNTVVGTFTTTDPDENDTHIYSLVAGEGSAGNELFQIKDNQLQTNSSLDYEEQEEYSIRVQTDDGNGGKFAQVFTIKVVNQSDDPNQQPTNITLDNNTISENQPLNTLVGRMTTEDPNDAIFSYTLVNGSGSTHNDLFVISENELRSAVSFDYETQGQYSVRIQTDDGKGGTFSKAFSIVINDVEDRTNRLPTDITLSNSGIEENQPTGTLIGSFSTADPDSDDQHQFQLLESDDQEFFSIDGNELVSAASFDYATRDSYIVRVKTDDGRGGNYTKTFAISITPAGNINPLGVVNPIEDQQAAVDEDFSLMIPDDVFQGNVSELSVTQADDSALPEWLTFNAETNTLSGTPPEGNTSITVKVTATNPQGNSVSDEFILSVEGVTALGDEISRHWKVYPVPAQDYLVIENQNTANRLQSYRLMSVHGKTVLAKQYKNKIVEDIRVEVEALPKGIYLLELQTNKGLDRRRLLIQ